MFVQPSCNLHIAEPGCLQFFTGVSGKMLSFNYNDGSGLQISNTDYAMCVRMERNFCGIQYTACIDLVNSPAMSFSISSPDTSSGEAPELSKVGSSNVGKPCYFAFNLLFANPSVLKTGLPYTVPQTMTHQVLIHALTG